MQIDMWKGRLQAFVDEELSADESAQCAAHLRDCAACASESTELLRMKRLVKRAGNKFSPSPDFQSRMLRQISGSTAPAALKPTSAFRPWIPMAIAASILLAVFFVASRISGVRNRDAFAELTDVHVTTLASANPVDVVSSDRHTVKPWFQGKIPFAFSLPELANSPYTLLGGRVAYFHQNPGAQLIYEVRHHRISLFIFANNVSPVTVSDAGSQGSFTRMSWSRDGLQYFLVTDASHDEAEPLHALFENMQIK